MTVAIVGIGYVGLPLVQAFSRIGRQVVAYDVDRVRIAELMEGHDRNATDDPDLGPMPGVTWTNEPHWLSTATDIIIAVPTPVDHDRRPNFTPMISAAETVGAHMQRGALVVIECTVHPGATEDLAGPALERVSGMVRKRDFHLAYSPERINPGDGAHDLTSVMKVVAGEDAATLERVAKLYESVVTAGVHRAPSIKVAEAAKITENVQRDLNIALMNELSQIFDRLDIRTADVLAAAGTKWNFAKYTPGLVGGHCIGVDPYYLIAKAEAHGYYPELIRSARRLNDGMADRVAQKIVVRLSSLGIAIAGARVGLMGLAFKENVSDARNSQAPTIARALQDLGAVVLATDPLVDPALARRDLGLEMVEHSRLVGLDALVLASPHRVFLAEKAEGLAARVRAGGLLVDVTSALDPSGIPGDRSYWSL